MPATASPSSTALWPNAHPVARARRGPELGARRPLPRLHEAIEAAIGRLRSQASGGYHGTDGSFTRDDAGNFTGTIRTLTLNVKATINPSPKEHDKAPDYRFTASGTDLCDAGRRRRRRAQSDLVALSRPPAAPFGAPRFRPGRIWMHSDQHYVSVVVSARISPAGTARARPYGHASIAARSTVRAPADRGIPTESRPRTSVYAYYRSRRSGRMSWRSSTMPGSIPAPHSS